MGSWAVLVANKFVEGSEEGRTARRVIQMILGVVFGLFAQLLSGWMLVDRGPVEGSVRLVRRRVRPDVPACWATAAYFGLVGLAVDWWT